MKMRWPDASTAAAEARLLNGPDRRPSPFTPAAGSTNQITGPAAPTVTVAGALHIDGPGLPLSHTVYVNVTSPEAPGGGSKSKLPVPVFRLEIVPPVGVVALVVPKVKVAEYPPSPVSGSVAPVSSPVRPVIFMLACAL